MDRASWRPASEIPPPAPKLSRTSCWRAAGAWRTRITITVTGIQYVRSGSTHVFALVLVGCGGFLLFLEMEGLSRWASPSSQSSDMLGQIDQLKLELTRARIHHE